MCLGRGRAAVVRPVTVSPGRHVPGCGGGVANWFGNDNIVRRPVGHCFGQTLATILPETPRYGPYGPLARRVSDGPGPDGDKKK